MNKDHSKGIDKDADGNKKQVTSSKNLDSKGKADQKTGKSQMHSGDTKRDSDKSRTRSGDAQRSSGKSQMGSGETKRDSDKSKNLNAQSSGRS